jgi:hypothetical protein
MNVFIRHPPPESVGPWCGAGRAPDAEHENTEGVVLLPGSRKRGDLRPGGDRSKAFD